jgi:hypothetical protein
MLLRLARRVALAAMLPLGFASPAVACQCNFFSFEYYFAQSEAVFTGIPRSIGTFESQWVNQRAVTLEVTAVWKGDVPAEVVVLTGFGSGDCGTAFTLDDEWLVYTTSAPLDPFDPTGPWMHWTDSCWRSAPALNNPDLGRLGPPPSTPATGSSWGRLKAHYR